MSAALSYQAVLFDMDGVILDSMPQHASLWQELMAELGLDVPLSFILENEGALGPEVLVSLFESRGYDQRNLVQLQAGMPALLARQARLYLERHAGQVSTFPGARRLLRGLAALGVPTALVTSSRRALVQRCLDQGILQSFRAVVSAEDVSRHKPHPDPYLKAAQTLGAEPARCLVVENAPAGIASARAAGATCYALATTLPPESLNQAQAVFPDLWRLAEGLGLSLDQA